jgi:hypothetical protein
MAEAHFDIEQLLRNALAPVEPSASLSERMDQRLTELTAVAFDELADWELAAMRDPRNWARPAAAVVAGGTAGAVLVLLRARRRGAARPAALEEMRESAERAVREIARETRRLLGER